MVRLQLYIAGQSRNSMLALKNLNSAIAGLPSGAIDLTVTDVLNHPLAALDEGVLVTPTLIRRAPLPHRIIIGTLGDPDDLTSLLELDGKDRGQAAQ